MKTVKRIVTPSERVLLTNLKRVVTRGKRGRGVPVLFSTDVQENIQLMLKVRSSIVPKENPYLFAKANSINEISGYKILSKYAQLCGAKNPTLITSTRLRKHLATITQIFNMNDGDIEQLATFMGHTSGIHRGSYRLPDDVYQTAKLSKLLLLMEKGEADNYKGKSLEEIDLNMEENLLEETKPDESDIDSDEEETKNNEENLINTRNENLIERNSSRCKRFNRESRLQEEKETDNLKSRHKKEQKKRVLIPWTDKQKLLVKNFFKGHIKRSKPPKRYECEELIEQYPQVFSNKNWLKMKVFVQNEYTKK